MTPVKDKRNDLTLDKKTNTKDLAKLILYLHQLNEGDTLKIRVNDPECDYVIDSVFPLKGFKEAATPLMKAFLAHIKEKDDELYN